MCCRYIQRNVGANSPSTIYPVTRVRACLARRPSPSQWRHGSTRWQAERWGGGASWAPGSIERRGGVVNRDFADCASRASPTTLPRRGRLQLALRLQLRSRLLLGIRGTSTARCYDCWLIEVADSTNYKLTNSVYAGTGVGSGLQTSQPNVKYTFYLVVEPEILKNMQYIHI